MTSSEWIVVAVAIVNALVVIGNAVLIQSRLERYKSELGVYLARANRFDEHEFTALKELWSSIHEAERAVGDLVMNGTSDQGYPGRRSSAGQARVELAHSVREHSIYIPLQLEERITRIQDTLIRAELNFNTGSFPVANEGHKIWRDEVRPELSSPKTALRQYLREHEPLGVQFQVRRVRWWKRLPGSRPRQIARNSAQSGEQGEGGALN